MENKNSRNTRIAYVVALILGLIIIGICQGCGTRKVQKSEVKTEEKTVSQIQTVDSTKTATTIDTNTKVVDLSETNEIQIFPVDTSKVMVVNGKSYFNAVLKTKKTSNNTVVDKTEKVSQIEQKAVNKKENTTTEKKSESKTKDVERKQFDWTKIIIVVAVIIFLFVLFFLWYFGIGKKKSEK